MLNNHFHPKPSEIAQRWKFNTRNRKPEESVGDYVTELRKLTQDCNFGDSLTVMLRDCLVCGINEDRIQRRLLAEDGLTFEKVLKFALAMEAANRDIENVRNMAEQSWFSKGIGSVNWIGGGCQLEVTTRCQEVLQMWRDKSCGQRLQVCHRKVSQLRQGETYIKGLQNESGTKRRA